MQVSSTSLFIQDVETKQEEDPAGKRYRSGLAQRAGEARPISRKLKRIPGIHFTSHSGKITRPLPRNYFPSLSGPQIKALKDEAMKKEEPLVAGALEKVEVEEKILADPYELLTGNKSPLRHIGGNNNNNSSAYWLRQQKSLSFHSFHCGRGWNLAKRLSFSSMISLRVFSTFPLSMM